MMMMTPQTAVLRGVSSQATGQVATAQRSQQQQQQAQGVAMMLLLLG
jgi:hypothetical protein